MREEMLKQMAEDHARTEKALIAWWKKLTAAKDPATAPQKLARLSEDKDTEIRYYVAANRSTPPEVLARLAVD